MLTKDLLQYRVYKGAVRPKFIDTAAPELLGLADALVAVPEQSLGVDRATIEAQLAACHAGFSQPKIAAGLVKLTLDRMTFEEPSEEAAQLRERSFTEASRLLRGLSDDATEEQYEQQLQGLVSVRDSLYADHPENRLLLEWKPLTGNQLLERYNLALVQGLVMRSRRVEVRAIGPDILRVRKLLRWMKFCRLIGDLHSTGDDWTLAVEGPAEILSMSKKYGLQLAQFVAAVPVLEWYELRAQIELYRGSEPVRLELDHKSGLVSPHDIALGHVPPEIDVVIRKLSDADWKVDPSPMPRAVGAGDLCVPDLVLTRSDASVSVSFEFFHPWHRFQLTRRLEQLRTKDDPYLILAVDEHLLTEPILRAEVEAHPQVMLFKGFPSERKIRAILDRFDAQT